jgi:hypothetical protein
VHAAAALLSSDDAVGAGDVPKVLIIKVSVEIAGSNAARVPGANPTTFEFTATTPAL